VPQVPQVPMAPIARHLQTLQLMTLGGGKETKPSQDLSRPVARLDRAHPLQEAGCPTRCPHRPHYSLGFPPKGSPKLIRVRNQQGLSPHTQFGIWGLGGAPPSSLFTGVPAVTPRHLREVQGNARCRPVPWRHHWLDRAHPLPEAGCPLKMQQWSASHSTHQVPHPLDRAHPPSRRRHT
jgi:hypothetical protein